MRSSALDTLLEEYRVDIGLRNDARAELNTLRSQLASVTKERDEAISLLRDIIPPALARAPKSIHNRECFTLNLGRAFLNRPSLSTLARSEGGAE